MQAVVVAELGVEGHREHVPLRARPPGWPSTSPRISTPGPCSAIHGARMKIPRSGPPASPRSATSASKLLDLAPERVARGADVHQPEVLAVEHDQPRARPKHRSARSGRARAAAPPGPRARCRASSSWTPRPVSRARRGRPGRRARAPRACRAPSPRSIRSCASKPPCSASTPISSGSRSCAGQRTARSRVELGKDAENVACEQHASERGRRPAKAIGRAATSRAGPAAARPRAWSSRG